MILSVTKLYLRFTQATTNKNKLTKLIKGQYDKH